LLALALLIVTAFSVQAQENVARPEKPAKLFSSNDTLQVTLTAPWRELVINTSYKGNYPAKLEYTDGNGNPVSLNLTVERRGVKREQLCRYPPIRLRFDKDEVKGTAFRGQVSIKMVTHCEKASRYQQYYVTEMLIYRMYNLVTDYSFRVRPLEVNYVDSENGHSDKPRFAFLIEDDSDVAKRHGLKKLVIPRVSPKQLDPELSSEFAVFQYLIGNVDWAALSGPDPEECCHNVKLIAPRPLQDGDIIYPIPYDFDSSGLVNADYAAPPNGLGLSYVTQRLYRGFCKHNDTMEQARQWILSKESEVLSLIDDEPLLNSSRKRQANKYLDRGFNTLKDPQDFEKQLIQKCRR
jgi:hypothetical protein